MLMNSSSIMPAVFSMPQHALNERFRSIHFNSSTDTLLACGVRLVLIWVKKAMSSWSDVSKLEPHIEDIPWYNKGEFRKAPLKTTSFRKRKGFLVYDDQGFFLVFIGDGRVERTAEVRCERMMSPAISYDDHHLFYIRRSKGNRKKGSSKWIFVLFQRAISGTEVQEETSMQHLNDLLCGEDVEAQMSIRQTKSLDELVIFTTKGQATSISLNRTSATVHNANSVLGGDAIPFSPLMSGALPRR
jgi:hypothetical protein